MPGDDLAAMMTELRALEQQVSDAAAAVDPKNQMRVYPWRPPGTPELPLIMNWIDDGSVEIMDTARTDDAIFITVSIGVNAAHVNNNLDRLLVLADTFRSVVDPVLHHRNRPLNGTAKRAKRLVTRSELYDLGGIQVQALDMILEVHLTRTTG
jgi:hypothetical protein